MVIFRRRADELGDKLNAKLEQELDMETLLAQEGEEKLFSFAEFSSEASPSWARRAATPTTPIGAPPFGRFSATRPPCFSCFSWRQP